MSAIIPGPVYALVDGVLELCFPRTLVNAMLPNAIYRILDSTRTEYIVWKYIVTKNRNVLFEFTISSLKYVYILFDRDAALMPVPQKSRTNRADEAAALHHSDLESALSRVSHSASDEDSSISAEWM